MYCIIALLVYGEDKMTSAEGEPELSAVPTEMALAAYAPFGFQGFWFGWGGVRPLHNTLSTLSRLDTTQAVSRNRYWRIIDYESLDDALILEDCIPDLAVASEVPPTERRRLASRLLGHLATYHEALPFDEAERRWLSETYQALLPDKSPLHRMITNQLRTMTGNVMSAGRQRSVSGRDLTERWWSWVRQTDDFEGQESLDNALEALASMRAILIPDIEKARAAGVMLLERLS
jgi:hypothetical protein